MYRPLMFARTLLALALLLISLPGRGHFPAVFGRDFVLSAQPGTAGQAPLLPSGERGEATPAVSPGDTARLEDALLALEHGAGPYAPGLYEPLSQLGRMHRDQGDYDEALDLYERALHVVRINDGLLGQQQVPLLRELLALYRREGKLGKLDQGHDYYFRVFGSGQPPYDVARKAAVREYLDWQREAHALGIDSDSNARLVELYRVTERMLAAAIAEPEPDLEWQRELVFSQLRNLYLVLGELPVEEQVSGRSASGASDRGKTGSPEFVRQRMTSLQHTGVARGRTLLTAFLDRWPDLDPLERAAIQMELANWYQWNEYYQSAESEYRQVIALLHRQGAEPLIVEWFDRAVELPENDAFTPAIEAPETGGPYVLEANFTVSARGNVSGIEITNASDQDSNRAIRLKRWLRETHFRPRYLPDGERMDSRLSRSYQLFR